MQISGSLSSAKKRCFLLTGGTGFLGSFVAAEFLSRGDFVIFMVRPGRTEEEAREEIFSRLQKIKGEEAKKWDGQWSIVRGDIVLPELGLGVEARQALKEKVTDIFHAAASVRFRESRQSAWEINVEGVRKMLKLAEDLGATFHHVSTAYVAGKRTGLIREDELEMGQQFNNIYEETKYEGERLVRTFLASGRRAIIYRPSIVTGATNTGLAFSFNAFYVSAKIFDDIRNWQQEKAWHARIPLCIPLRRDARINLMPVDYLAKIIGALSMDERSLGKTFHISHPKATLVAGLFQDSLQIFGVKNRKIFFMPTPLLYFSAEIAHYVSFILGKRGRILRNRLLIFLPYITTNDAFDRKNVKGILGEKIVVPDLGREYLQKILSYAVEHEFKQ